MSVLWRASSGRSVAGVLPAAVTLVTGPTAEPIDIEDAKLHIRETATEQDDLIKRLIKAARRQCEAVTDLKLLTQTWDLTYDEFPGASTYPIWLPMAPMLATAPVVTYVDTDGATQTWSSALYRVVAPTVPPFVRRPGYILPVFDGEYPDDVRDITRALTVRVVVGFGTSGASVPEDLITDMLALIGTWFTEGRQSVLTGTFVSRVPDMGMFHHYRPAV